MKRSERIASFLLAVGVTLGISGCTSTKEEQIRIVAKCTDDGWRAFERYKSDLAQRYQLEADSYRLTALPSPQFHFSGRLNTCLMLVRHSSFTSQTAYSYKVIDVYSNRIVEQTLDSDTDAEFKAHIDEANKLMSE
jgi:hypothetical protein